jgi:hypothetical protein
MSYRRVGVYVDSMNIMRSGGYGMRYEVIRRFAGHNTDEVTRLNAYVAIDEERAISDPAYKNTLNFILTLRDLGSRSLKNPSAGTPTTPGAPTARPTWTWKWPWTSFPNRTGWT